MTTLFKTKKLHAYIHAPTSIWTRDLSVRAAQDHTHLSRHGAVTPISSSRALEKLSVAQLVKKGPRHLWDPNVH